MDFKIFKEVDAESLEPGEYVLAKRDYINEEFEFSPLFLHERCKIVETSKTYIIIEKV